MNLTKWDIRFFNRVEEIRNWSKDQSTKVGCCFVKDNRSIVEGYNGLPPYLNDDNEQYHQRPDKYYYFEHAERNAIYLAHKNKLSLEDSHCYLNWIPCPDCMRAILNHDIIDIRCNLTSQPHREDMVKPFEASIHLAASKGVPIFVTYDLKEFSILTDKKQLFI